MSENEDNEIIRSLDKCPVMQIEGKPVELKHQVYANFKMGIIGVDLLKRLKSKIDFDENTIEIRDNENTMRNNLLDEDPKRRSLIFHPENSQKGRYLNCLGKCFMAEEIHSNFIKEISKIITNTQNPLRSSSRDVLGLM